MNIIGVDYARSSKSYTVLSLIKVDKLDILILDSHIIKSATYENSEREINRKIKEWEKLFGSCVITKKF